MRYVFVIGRCEDIGLRARTSPTCRAALLHDDFA